MANAAPTAKPTTATRSRSTKSLPPLRLPLRPRRRHRPRHRPRHRRRLHLRPRHHRRRRRHRPPRRPQRSHRQRRPPRVLRRPASTASGPSSSTATSAATGTAPGLRSRSASAASRTSAFGAGSIPRPWTSMVASRRTSVAVCAPDRVWPPGLRLPPQRRRKSATRTIPIGSASKIPSGRERTARGSSATRGRRGRTSRPFGAAPTMSTSTASRRKKPVPAPAIASWAPPPSRRGSRRPSLNVHIRSITTLLTLSHAPSSVSPLAPTGKPASS
mmetsp:Transcript_18799/g.60787  ORF Transcript_18799/g.60787 Transcript_18799/m.60787 type:complete len:273 (+) Transcript_18799:3041-3859(+)